MNVMSQRADKAARDAAYAHQILVAKNDVYFGLDPVDLRRCQGEFKLPQNPFRMCDPPPRWVRCDRIPVMVAIEAKSVRSLRGAMTLCRSCADMCMKAKPGEIYLPAAPFKTALRLGGHAAVRTMVYEVPEQ